MRVVGVGDNVVDKYMHSGMMYPGGNALNFAVYASRLGVQAAYLGVFGSDVSAKLIKDAACQEGVSLLHCLTLEGENGYACVDVVKGDRRFVYSNKGGIAGQNPMILGCDDLAYLRRFDLVCTSVNSCMTDELPKLRLLQNIVAFDFSEQHDETTIARYCPHADYTIISCGKLSLDEARAKIELCHRAGARFVLATRGAHGALFSDGSTIYMKAAIRIDARDSLGAGDAYLTAFLLCFVPWEAISGQVATKTERYSAVARAMQAGNTFASSVCMQDGAFGYGAPIA